jgi:hypothetical protein
MEDLGKYKINSVKKIYFKLRHYQILRILYARKFPV